MNALFSMSVAAAVFLLLLTGISKTLAYQIPELTFEKLEDGFRVSIPEEKDISRVAFHINRNRPFETFEQGDFSEEVRLAENGRFVYEVKRKIEQNDRIYAWISVQYKDLVYRKIAEPIAAKFINYANGDKTTNNKPNTNSNTNTNVAEKPEPTKCEPTVTIATKQNQKFKPNCRGELIFNEDFNGSLDPSVWTTEVRLASDNCEAEFVLYNTTNVFIRNNILQLRATLWNDNAPGTEVRKGMLDLGEACTERSEQFCRREPSGAIIMPPIISGRINTKSSFSFQYGRVLIRAKFPIGDWLYPLLYLEPKIIYIYDPQPCFHVRIAFSRGNRYLQNTANTEDVGSHRLSGGVIFTATSKFRDQFVVNKTSWESFSNEYHIYEMIWNEHDLTFKIDDNEYGRISVADMNSANFYSRRNSGVNRDSLNREFSLTLGLAAGGHADFPERGFEKPWVNTGHKAELNFWERRESWLNTWSDPSLYVDYIRVYAV